MTDITVSNLSNLNSQALSRLDSKHSTAESVSQSVPRSTIQTSDEHAEEVLGTVFLAVHYVHECDNRGARWKELGAPDDADVVFILFSLRYLHTLYQYGPKGWAKMIIRDGWKCILICIGGLGLLVASDSLTDKDFLAISMVKGDIFMIFGATLYGFTNATEEFFVRRRPLYEVVGQLGMWGTIINGIQAAGLEHNDMRTANWDGENIGILIAYTASMFILYTVAPLLYRMASSAYYNISFLTSDFYDLLFGLFLFHYKPFWLHFPAFAVVIVGLIVYFWSATPEEQGKLDPRAPAYINKRGEDRENTVEGSPSLENSKV
ncbi:hypothetical protein EW145_g1678 [Phellinidium pouzarii]|uniref:DUF914 domain-containing protein n=1 Tax=Phellinidium pouzarii TaxID=167371 RepID=A0A4S4LFB9_9AGAM|nr:hypothetical protein EW145_g1678 [Phellinidium pouzarii]